MTTAAVADATPRPAAPAAAPPDLVPAMRQDVRLVNGPAEPSGAPTWQLIDPLRHLYFRIGWVEFECLARWRLGTPTAIAAAVTNSTTLQVTADDVRQFARFLAAQQLVRVQDAPHAPRVPRWQRAFMKLVYYRVPLARPQAGVDRALPHLGWLWLPGPRLSLALLALATLWALASRGPELAADLARYANEAGLLLGLAVLAVTKTLHELGHAVAARRHGVRVPALGLAFVFAWPMPYVDTTDTWRIHDRRARLEIALAGIVTEVLIAITASLAWLYLSPGWPRDVCLFVAVLSWTLSLLVNLNPLMRFDGYYALVDATGLDNLQTRAFAWLRYRLLAHVGIAESPPEAAPPSRARMLLVYGAASALYRVLIYVGVTALVCSSLPRALAVPLLVAGWYVLAIKPVQRDLLQFWQRWRASPTGPANSGQPNGPETPKLPASRAARFVAVAALLLFGYVALPLPRTLETPAVFGAAEVNALHAPEGAWFQGWRVRHGDTVQAGQVIAELSSAELDRDIAKQHALLAELSQRFAARANSGYLTSQEEVEAARRTLDALETRQAALTIRAPRAGRVFYRGDAPRARQPLAGDTELAVVIGGSGVVQAFVPAAWRGRLAAGDEALFYDQRCSPSCAPIALQAMSGGSQSSVLTIAPRLRAFVRSDSAQDDSLLTLRFAAVQAPADHERFGVVRLRTEPISYAWDALRRGLGIARREIGV